MVFDWIFHDTHLSKYLVIFGLSAKMDVILWIFHGNTKVRIYWFSQKCPYLVYLLQGVLQSTKQLTIWSRISLLWAVADPRFPRRGGGRDANTKTIIFKLTKISNWWCFLERKGMSACPTLIKLIVESYRNSNLLHETLFPNQIT